MNSSLEDEQKYPSGGMKISGNHLSESGFDYFDKLCNRCLSQRSVMSIEISALPVAVWPVVESVDKLNNR